MLDRIAYNLLQVLVVVAFAPLVEGVTTRLKEIIQSKRGPSIFQPYRDIWKLRPTAPASASQGFNPVEAL